MTNEERMQRALENIADIVHLSARPGNVAQDILERCEYALYQEYGVYAERRLERVKGRELQDAFPV